MDESSKTNRLRNGTFRDRYFSGRVLDIGCGPDPVVPHAIPFDMDQGDAQEVSRYFAAQSFDCVHSSHCLEHMRDVPAALRQWWSLVRPGGYLIIIVPDEDLYEQGVWPSAFNPDHKATFRLNKRKSWSPVSYEISGLISSLPQAQLVASARQDDGYNHLVRVLRLARHRTTLETLIQKTDWFLVRQMQHGLPVYRIQRLVEKVGQALPSLLDQTLGEAVAQIEVIAQKGRA